MTTNHARAVPAQSLPLPMTRQEMISRGWSECDIVLVTGDAYVDHPAFGVALIGRWLEHLGYRVGVIAQPNPQQPENFLVLGRPKLFWGITAGNLDSELACLTVMRKLRRDDPYSPGGSAGRRPRNATMVYTACARHAYPGIPVILGGVEASLRRFAYYDYWTDKIKRALLFDAKADVIVYGMAERALAELSTRRCQGLDWHGRRGTAEIRKELNGLTDYEELPAFEIVARADSAGKKAFLEMALQIERNLDPYTGKTLVQKHGDRWLVVYPPADPLTAEEMDRLYALPFTRRPHPKYAKGRIPACDMIQDSLTIHRGCYGGCRFCALGAHQGRTISSRSMAGILDDIQRRARDPAFHGVISDLGGPTANMYGTFCRRPHSGCPRRSCLAPAICPHLQTDAGPMRELLRAARRLPGIRHVFIASGIRYDLALAGQNREWLKDVIAHHTSGRLKIAPEHVSDQVLCAMRKPPAKVYHAFLDQFRQLTRAPYDVLEYFISGHPGCTLQDMVELAWYLRRAGIQPEQVQDFYPAPLTMAAAMFYSGLDPETRQPIYVARSDREKSLQRALLLCHRPEFYRKAREALREAGRADLIGWGKNCLVPPASVSGEL